MGADPEWPRVHLIPRFDLNRRGVTALRGCPHGDWESTAIEKARKSPREDSINKQASEQSMTYLSAIDETVLGGDRIRRFLSSRNVHCELIGVDWVRPGS